MNIIEKIHWVSKTVNLPLNSEYAEVDKIAELKEFLRANKLVLVVNEYRQIEIKQCGEKVIGTTGPVFGGS